MAEHTVVLLVAHGSRAAGAPEAHAGVCEAVASRTGVNVRPAFLELNPPAIPDAIDAAVASGAARVVLVPFFLHPGNHTQRDLPALLADARQRHARTHFELAPLFGADERIVALAADQVAAAVRGGPLEHFLPEV